MSHESGEILGEVWWRLDGSSHLSARLHDDCFRCSHGYRSWCASHTSTINGRNYDLFNLATTKRCVRPFYASRMRLSGALLRAFVTVSLTHVTRLRGISKINYFLFNILIIKKLRFKVQWNASDIAATSRPQQAALRKFIIFIQHGTLPYMT